MKPINTFLQSWEKWAMYNEYKGMNSDQVFLSMSQYAQFWIEIPLIYIKRRNDSIRKIIGVDVKAKYSIHFFFWW
jgi:hypothetical protein